MVKSLARLAMIAALAGAGCASQSQFLDGMFARYHESTERLALLSAPGPIVGRDVRGRLVVAAPVDYVAWTQRAALFARRDDLKTPNRLIWVSGQLDRRAYKDASALGWSIYENFTIAAER